MTKGNILVDLGRPIAAAILLCAVTTAPLAAQPAAATQVVHYTQWHSPSQAAEVIDVPLYPHAQPTTGRLLLKSEGGKPVSLEVQLSVICKGKFDDVTQWYQGKLTGKDLWRQWLGWSIWSTSTPAGGTISVMIGNSARGPEVDIDRTFAAAGLSKRPAIKPQGHVGSFDEAVGWMKLMIANGIAGITPVAPQPVRPGTFPQVARVTRWKSPAQAAQDIRLPLYPDSHPSMGRMLLMSEKGKPVYLDITTELRTMAKLDALKNWYQKQLGGIPGLARKPWPNWLGSKAAGVAQFEAQFEGPRWVGKTPAGGSVEVDLMAIGEMGRAIDLHRTSVASELKGRPAIQPDSKPTVEDDDYDTSAAEKGVGLPLYPRGKLMNAVVIRPIGTGREQQTYLVKLRTSDSPHAVAAWYGGRLSGATVKDLGASADKSMMSYLTGKGPGSRTWYVIASVFHSPPGQTDIALEATETDASGQ